MALTAPFNIDTDYTFQLGGSDARGDSTACNLQIRTVSGNGGQFSNITPAGSTSNVGYWKVERTFVGNTIRLAVVAAQGTQPLEDYLEFRFSVGLGANGCQAAVTTNPGGAFSIPPTTVTPTVTPTNTPTPTVTPTQTQNYE